MLLLCSGLVGELLCSKLCRHKCAKAYLMVYAIVLMVTMLSRIHVNLLGPPSF